MTEESDTLHALKARFAEALTEAEETENELRLTIAPESLAALCHYLRDEPSLAFDYPADLTARDTGEQIVLWIRLVSMRHNRTALLHVVLPCENPVVSSLTPIWPGMNWHERECFDLFGIRFLGHPDDGDPARMRILLPEDWEGHPFRHDYEPVFSGDPLHGPQERN
ncbi:MAG TPA: NADH-quinone oxidoreductase subunit C [Chthonomonadaceae bacterium]|nr:NADH-quinone oxidoreductase subunit C [Chthonomonadaceae bacterium]